MAGLAWFANAVEVALVVMSDALTPVQIAWVDEVGGGMLPNQRRYSGPPACSFFS